ncbi:HAD-IA family hydrolase [Corynebacterium epidermidicanis]|uniref:Haloacid dehalogenase superfamily enzyme, subfamily IA n=1 Tax=Corynebacterium epidermidicanis TaxID=1050174 RepID=A0A0G3GSP5_9CORY|nr:HAD-IA family hydrolase [Corynebacterium epidermidicanis]AKK03605.1 haloacid dehalogenase superfamily enzyme, subfamily IA [Corynebacterium epidermidicanis]
MHILFVDVDGTLIDSFPGIRASYLHTLDQLQWPTPSEDVIAAIPGPPMEDSMRALGMSPEQAREALGVYLKHYGEVGYAMSTPYPGMHEFLRTFSDAGFLLCTATSKGEQFARQALEMHGYLEFFDFIGAAEEDGTRRSKAAVIAHVLDTMQLRDQTHSILMIGDRIHDIEGAGQFGIDTVVVDWGYGTEEERNLARFRAHDAIELESIVHEWSAHRRTQQ